MDNIKNGDKVLFSVQGLDGKFKASIYAVDPKIDLATRRCSFGHLAANPGGKIFRVSFARVELVLNQTKGALMVPTESIIPILKRTESLFV